MNKALKNLLFGFLVVFANNIVADTVAPVVATMPIDLKEKLALSRIGSAIASNKDQAVPGIISQYQMLAHSSKQLIPHMAVTRDPGASPDDAASVRKQVVQQLRAKLDTNVLKSAHAFAQGGPLRTLVDKALKAKVAWADEGTQLKKFLELNKATFEASLEKFFDEMSTTDLYRLVCELKVILETLHDNIPDGKNLLAGLRAHMLADRAIIKNHSHAPAPAEVTIVQ